MINKTISFDLPVPWRQKRFETPQIGSINFLVGPNGSGKSKFAEALQSHLPKARMLGTDRLSGMEQTNALRSIFGDHLANGLAKNHFSNFKNAGQKGSGIDTIVLLEERMELRIQVEATLGHLFNRKIILEWDSGNLVARAVLGETGNSYRFDRDECHGIKELLVLLTHLYNDEHSYLIIDEPELNLHLQYQAFFMQEVRKLAGDPTADRGKKVIFLITLLEQVQAHLNTIQRATIKVFSVQELNRGQHKEFSAVVLIAEMLGQKKRLVHVNHQTNAGMGDFKIEFA